MIAQTTATTPARTSKEGMAPAFFVEAALCNDELQGQEIEKTVIYVATCVPVPVAVPVPFEVPVPVVAAEERPVVAIVRAVQSLGPGVCVQVASLTKVSEFRNPCCEDDTLGFAGLSMVKGALCATVP